MGLRDNDRPPRHRPRGRIPVCGPNLAETRNESFVGPRLYPSANRRWTTSRHNRPRRTEARTVLGELDRFSETLAIPDVVTEEAARICIMSVERGLTKGRTVVQFLASSLYAACRENDVPRTLDDISFATGVDRRDIARYYRLLVNELDLKVPIVDPMEFMPKVALRVKVNQDVVATALDILQRAEKNGVVAGLDPIGLTASALYLAAAIEGVRLTQRDAAEAAGVTEVTIRNELRRLNTVLIPP